MHDFAPVPTAAVLDPDLPSSALRVLAVLASYQNKESGRCDPSLATVGKCIGVSRQAVAKHLPVLVERGYLTYTTTRLANGKPKYHFTLIYPSNPRLLSSKPAVAGMVTLATGDSNHRLPKQELEQEKELEHGFRSRGTTEDYWNRVLGRP